MKRLCGIILALIMLISVFSVSVYAEDTSQTYKYELSVDGQEQKTVKTGDIITVVLHLTRTDSQDAYTMYAMQDEIRYDSDFFELVEGNEILAEGIQSTDIAMRDNYREFYMNYLSLSGGKTWDAKTLIGSFQLRVIGTSGVSKITNEDYLVSLKDGSGSYQCEANELTIIISTDCTIHFESNGGTLIDDVVAVYGETFDCPKAPERDGKYFAGWFKDIDCTEEWDFENDKVSGNMTLYAKWSDVPVVDADVNQAQGQNGFNMLWLILAVLAILIIVIIILKKRKQEEK